MADTIEKQPIIFSKINLTAVSKINCCTSECAICLNSLEIGCIQCINKGCSMCPSIKGECNHGFHDHCITQWLKKNNKCPLDSKDWKQITNF